MRVISLLSNFKLAFSYPIIIFTPAQLSTILCSSSVYVLKPLCFKNKLSLAPQSNQVIRRFFPFKVASYSWILSQVGNPESDEWGHLSDHVLINSSSDCWNNLRFFSFYICGRHLTLHLISFSYRFQCSGSMRGVNISLTYDLSFHTTNKHFSTNLDDQSCHFCSSFVALLVEVLVVTWLLVWSSFVFHDHIIAKRTGSRNSYYLLVRQV